MTTNQRLMKLLSNRGLFDDEFSAEIMPMLTDGNPADVLAAAAAMGDAVAGQADALADYFDSRHSPVDAAKLRSKAKLLHAEWSVMSEAVQ